MTSRAERRKIWGYDGFWKEIGRKRGDTSEMLVLQSLKLLIEQGKMVSIESSYGLEEKGIDFLIETTKGKKYKLQVKSSRAGVEDGKKGTPDPKETFCI